MIELPNITIYNYSYVINKRWDVNANDKQETKTQRKKDKEVKVGNLISYNNSCAINCSNYFYFKNIISEQPFLGLLMFIV
ncbi:MAG: hypothetical protein ACM3X7_05525 [Solirubrobacterales bacterium]